MNKKLLSRLTTVAFIGLFIWYGMANRSLISDLGAVSMASLLLVAIGKLGMHAIIAMFTKWTAEVFTKKLSIKEASYIGIWAAIGNFFGPLLGGAGVRAVYLKKKYNLSYGKFTSMLLGYYLIIFTLNFAIALWAVLVLPSSDQQTVLITVFAAGLVALISLYFIRLPLRSNTIVKRLESSQLGAKFVSTIYGIEEGLHAIIRSRGLLPKLMFLALMNFLTIYFLAAVQFSAIGIDIENGALALYAVFVNISLLLSFTPGAIGIRESLLILIGTTLAVGTEEILQVAIIDRGVNFILLLLLFLAVRNKKVKLFLAGNDSTQ